MCIVIRLAVPEISLPVGFSFYMYEFVGGNSIQVSWRFSLTNVNSYHKCQRAQCTLFENLSSSSLAGSHSILTSSAILSIPRPVQYSHYSSASMYVNEVKNHLKVLTNERQFFSYMHIVNTAFLKSFSINALKHTKTRNTLRYVDS